LIHGEFKFSQRVFLAAFVIILFVLVAIFLRSNHSRPDQYRVHIFVPWGMVAIFISFYLFSEFNRVRRAKRENRREYMNERRQEILDNVLKKNKKSTPNGD